MEYAVAVSPGTVSAWSRTRLAFEPRGWQVDYRRDLRAALRQLAGGSGQGLVAAYHTPNADFADLENVLLYNVGMAVFGPLIGAGITCHRYASTDGHHHMSYRVTAALPDPGGTQVLGMVAADLGSRLPVTAGQWWAALRPQTTAHHRIQPSTPVMVDVVLAGPGPSGARLANLIKSMLDGLVSCFHAHDGSQFAALLPRLATLGPAPAIWQQLWSHPQPRSASGRLSGPTAMVSSGTLATNYAPGFGSAQPTRTGGACTPACWPDVGD